MRILIVEDHLDSAQLFSAMLAHYGHEVRSASSGRAGLIQAKSYEPEAIIADIGLPDLTGYELAKELRKQERFKSTILIALSGYGQPLDVETAKAAGFDHHMTKPCNFEQLEALLSHREPESYEDQ
jgi:two-component system CheB/CheR fusion protein